MDERLAAIKMLILDVDGVLTDGRITMNEKGEEVKSFDVKDGFGLKLLMSAGVEVVIVSGRKSEVVKQRAVELGIGQVWQGVEDKKILCRKIIREKGLGKIEVCSIGDDLPDLDVFGETGLRVAVADAVGEVRDAADFVTEKRGGRGAVRELCELILKERGDWPSIGFTEQSRD
ncbi:MAG: HAD hydrolase family protein [Deltaproteobacteria bacterium]|nr:HAD hydrolase family protein [Deltaproteobacteria bacterium]MBW2049442.1 HAD hydrolase family protein [Deltaproteobacteria bacterium]MBW2112319.1 HAD hydrolase family protein [Deltaproteobacteria bacterium]MBW2354014.1 HAD hydrolase family protein [Deltaproteobacteria bacterium]HDZ91433.1 phenylphosphate carboxylase subunit delta [Deltaproteobacteria bacterium]